LIENTNYSDDDDLSCYFCEKEITQHKLSADGKELLCVRIDEETKKPYTYRAWADVLASENSYTKVVHGNGDVAYKYRFLKPMVAMFDLVDGSVIAHWKDIESPSSSYSDYVNPRGVGLFKRFMSDPELKERYDKNWQTTVDGKTRIVTRQRTG